MRSTALLSVCLGLLMIGCGTSAPEAAQDAPDVPVAAFGQPFPAASFGNLNPRPGLPATIDLAKTLGKQPIVLFYWIAGNSRADAMFQELQALAGELGPARIQLFGVVLPRPGREAETIHQRLTELNVEVPVLNDEGFRLGRALRVQAVPNLTLIDAQGKLRLTNGASLTQELEYKLDLKSAVRRIAETGTLSTYGYLEPYYPVKEMMGKKCPDFKAPLLSNSVVQHWSSMLNGQKLNVLIFWSVDCPHCRASLPEINAWLREHPDGLNVISAAKVTTDDSKSKTREFCEINGFVFPTLMDKDLEISKLFQVTSTPTIVIIRPDGVIDSVLLSAEQDFGKTIEQKKRELLKGGNAS